MAAGPPASSAPTACRLCAWPGVGPVSSVTGVRTCTNMPSTPQALQAEGPQMWLRALQTRLCASELCCSVQVLGLLSCLCSLLHTF